MVLGLALASAMISFTDRAATPGFTTITLGVVPTIAIVAKSFSVS
jgi:hypothetical protein